MFCNPENEMRLKVHCKNTSVPLYSKKDSIRVDRIKLKMNSAEIHLEL